MNIHIRPATPDDAEAVSALIRASAHQFLLDPAGRGAERFLDSIAPQALRGCIASPDFRYLVAVAGRDVVGAVALRDGRHLFHLFVAPACQRQGLARALWDAVRAGAAAEAEAFTVNSSPNAVAVYERFGFTATGPRTEVNGIAFVPMRAGKG